MKLDIRTLVGGELFDWHNAVLIGWNSEKLNHIVERIALDPPVAK